VSRLPEAVPSFLSRFAFLSALPFIFCSLIFLTVALNVAHADEKPALVTVSGKVISQTLSKKVAPVYPTDARRKGIQGTVRLHILIGTDGRVRKVEIVSGDSHLVRSAIEAVKQWEYKPYLQDGKAVEVDSVCEVNYSLLP
jgi:TonB family protein